MSTITIISLVAAAVLGVLLWDRHRENRKLAADLNWQRDANMQLLKQDPVHVEGANAGGPEPLTLDKISDAVHFNGFVPEKQKDSVAFRVQGESYLIDAERLPLFFVIKGYSLDPADWDMDLLREAAHIMSDKLAIVKATISDDQTQLSFFVGAQDRNYESLRDNLTAYLRLLADGQRMMNEVYERMTREKNEAAISAQPIVPPAKQESKILS